MFDVITDPAREGFDRDRLDRIRPWMQRWVHQGKFPGAQTLIARRGELVYNDCVGLRDIETAAAWTPETIVRIYSMTKPVTSVAFLMLYEKALVHLDTPLDEILPEFKDCQVLVPGAERIDQVEPAKTRMTLHHLLTHTSGYTYGVNGGLIGEEMAARKLDFSVKEGDLAQTTRRLAQMPLAFDPGSRWNYGVSTDVLGRVVEVVSGQTLDRFFAENIFEPLGMKDTFFELPDDRLSRFASCYAKTPKNPLHPLDKASTSAFRQGQVRQFSGGGGLLSTGADYLRFAEMLRGRGALGSVRLLAPKTVEIMTRNALRGDLTSMGQPVFSEISYDGIGFGLGVAVMLDPGVAKTTGSEGDYGWGGMASTMFWVDPALDLIGIFLTQLVPSSTYPVRKEMRAMTYGSLLHP